LAPALFALIAAAAGLLPGLGRDEPAQAQPPLQFLAQHSIEITGTGESDILQFYIAFEPGTTIPFHQVTGPTIFTVLEGRVTRVEESGEYDVYSPGESFIELPTDHFDADTNRNSIDAVAISTLLLKPGADPLVVDPEAPDGPQPEFAVVNRVSAGVLHGANTLTHGVVVLPKGGVEELLTYPGMVSAAEVPGGRAMVALITSRTSPIHPPSTGDGGLAEGR
jgi:quercetin dioxygenase-like cupin family protein